MFLRYKHALLAHMGDFMAELDRYLPRLTLAVIQVEATGLATLLNRAAEADERPLMRYEDVLDDWRRRWAAVRAWFTADGEGSRAAELAAATRAGVSSVIALLRQITEAQRGGVNRATQLRHLAAWAFDAADEDAAHALVGAAFGLRRARHLGGVHEDSDLISPRLSWDDAPGVEVAVTLFRRGKAPTPGVPQRLQARDGVRADLRRRQAARRAAEQEAARQLLGVGAGGAGARRTTDAGAADVADPGAGGQDGGGRADHRRRGRQRRDGDAAGAVPGRLRGADRARGAAPARAPARDRPRPPPCSTGGRPRWLS